MVVSAAVGRLPVDFGLEDSRHWVSSTQVYNAVDVSHQGSAVSTWSQVFCLESVIDGTLGVGSDVEALIVRHTPLRYKLFYAASNNNLLKTMVAQPTNVAPIQLNSSPRDCYFAI
jgi:hypothetical protein